MDKPALVGVMNCVRHPHHHRGRLTRTHPVAARQILVQVLTVQALHRDVRERIGLARVVDRHDARVAHAAGRLGLVQKTRFDLRPKLIFARERNDLDGDFARQHRIVSRINDSIGAAADFIQDRESANRLRRRGHRQIERVERDGGCVGFRHRRRDYRTACLA